MIDRPVDNSLRVSAPVESWSHLDSAGELTRRRHERTVVEASRSVSLQHVSEAGHPGSPWCPADILDISLGGLCLLVLQDFPLPAGEARRMTIDLRSQPDFGLDYLGCGIRWYVQSGMVLTLGVGFDQPLLRLPTLLSCRRADPRQSTSPPAA